MRVAQVPIGTDLIGLTERILPQGYRVISDRPYSRYTNVVWLLIEGPVMPDYVEGHEAEVVYLRHHHRKKGFWQFLNKRDNVMLEWEAVT